MAKRRFERDKRERRAIARERIGILMGLAERASLDGKSERADRYARLAKSIGMRYNARLSRDVRMRICKGCGAYLAPGKTARVRTSRKMLCVTCRACGRVWRMPLKVKGGVNEKGQR